MLWNNYFNLDQWFKRRCCLKVFLIWSSGGPLIQQNGTICAILVEGIMRNNSVNLFWIWASGSEGDIVYKISYLELWWPSCSVEHNYLCNFERGHRGEYSCEVIWNLFKEKVYGRIDRRRTQTVHNPPPWDFGSGELKNTILSLKKLLFCVYSQ